MYIYATPREVEYFGKGIDGCHWRNGRIFELIEYFGSQSRKIQTNESQFICAKSPNHR